jgi:hypothetical protein
MKVIEHIIATLRPCISCYSRVLDVLVWLMLRETENNNNLGTRHAGLGLFSKLRTRLCLWIFHFRPPYTRSSVNSIISSETVLPSFTNSIYQCGKEWYAYTNVDFKAFQTKKVYKCPLP